MTTKDFVWHEVSIQRPYESEVLWDILTHIASLTSRGPLVWEARCKNSKMRYIIGTPKWSVSRIQEVFCAHTNVQFTGDVQREPVTEVRKLKISKPVLSLNTEVSAAMIRAALAAMTGAAADTECVLQIVLGAAFAPSTTPKHLPDPNATWLDAVLGNVHSASSEQRKAVREWAKENLAGKTVLVQGVPNPVEFTMNGIKETLNQPHKYVRAKNEALRDIVALLKGGEHVLEKVDDKGNPMVNKYHYIRIAIAEEPSFAVIRELMDGRCQFYSIVEKLKKKGSD